MTSLSRPWRIKNSIWENLDVICTKLNIKKSYNCTDKLIEASSTLILENIDITNQDIEKALVGMEYLINNDLFYYLIINCNDEKIISQIANILVSFINNKIQQTIVLPDLEAESLVCEERKIIENIIRGLTYSVKNHVKITTKARNRIDIFSPLNNVQIINFLYKIITILKEYYDIISLDNNCEKDHICVILPSC
ncbi:MAG: hypothetical protein QXF93_04830 [Saccharolobus sp.]